MPKTNDLSEQSKSAGPDYVRLAKFLLQPFLDIPDSLLVDCEYSSSKPKVWLRVAFEGTDRGKVFGRGGRNIHALRNVLETAANLAGQSLYLDIFGASDEAKPQREYSRDRDLESNHKQGQGQGKQRFRRPNNSKPPSKPRF
jgi:hypothetical protein